MSRISGLKGLLINRPFCLPRSYFRPVDKRGSRPCGQPSPSSARGLWTAVENSNSALFYGVRRIGRSRG